MAEKIAQYKIPANAGKWVNDWMQLALAEGAAPNRMGDTDLGVKVVLDNEKVKVTEVTWKPGQQIIDNNAEYRVVRVLSGGTLLRTYSDGKTEKIVQSAGDVYVLEPSRPCASMNIGKFDITLSNVELK